LRLESLVASARLVAASAGRLDKVRLLADCLRAAGPGEASLAVSWLSGELRQAKPGLGPAAIRAAWPGAAAAASTLSLADADQVFDRIAAARGKGSGAEKVRLLAELLAQATEPEQDFLARLVHGELRQGALEGVLAEAVARAAAVPPEEVRRAAMYAGNLGDVAAAALRGGVPALRAFGVQLFRPLQPMLAQPAASVDEALVALEEAAFDYKLDGARVQVHKQGEDVRVYSRLLNEVTVAVPELVEAVRLLPAREVVLDGEAIALRADGRPEPFQVTMRRFGRRLDVERLRAELPLSTCFFDLLYLEGETLLDRPARERFAALREILPPAQLVPRILTSQAAEAAAHLERALAAGHEGLVAKSLSAGYDAGRRGGAWLKLKQADTLDLVVLAAEWGNGRRQGWLSNLHLGARDPGSNGFVMLGKTFKGLTDATLAWQTRELLAREIGREGRIVHVRPELVVEIAFEGLQESPRYPGGLALRFARVKRYRSDKTAREADTIDRVRALHRP
jgi:DNA ligase-1